MIEFRSEKKKAQSNLKGDKKIVATGYRETSASKGAERASRRAQQEFAPITS